MAYGDTPQFGTTSLCRSCRNGHVVEAESFSGDVTFCHAMERPVAVKVVKCSNYYDKRLPNLSDLRKIAWDIDIDKKRNKIGFMSPDERAKSGDDERIYQRLKAPWEDDYCG